MINTVDMFKRKFEGLARLILVRGFSGALPLYVVAEYPRSGGTWVSQMLSEYLDVPFPRNRFPRFRTSIMHGHFRYFPTMRNVFVVLRDGRDVMVSYYYFSLFELELNNLGLVKIMRKELCFDDYHDIRRNLPRFIEYVFVKKRYPGFAWNEFVDSWIDRDVAFIKYENLLQQPVEELSKAINKVCGITPDIEKLHEVVGKYAFRNLAQRNPGEENIKSFLRKGVAGDWKKHFSSEARKAFNEFGGRELIRLGYEVDERWIEAKDCL